MKPTLVAILSIVVPCLVVAQPGPGSKVTIDGKPSLIATEVKTGDHVVKLRDADGTPVWMAWRPRRRT